MSKVTRILYTTTDQSERIEAMCSVASFIRADIWRRYGGLGTIGTTVSDIRKEINAKQLYTDLPIDGTVRAETIKDVLNDIYLAKESAKEKVRKDIHKRTNDKAERKRLYQQLKADDYLQDSFLHRRMRFHFKHGKSHTHNQFIVRSDKHSHSIVEGQLEIKLQLNKKSGGLLTLKTSSTGKNVQLNHSNLRVIVRNNKIEIHYVINKPMAKKPCGTQEIGVDKGYTECFADSNGGFHGNGFGQVMTAYSDQTKATGQARNKLRALAQHHEEKGHKEKAERIQVNNLGSIKISERRTRTRNQCRNMAYQSAHALVDQAKLIIAEDLSAPIASKHIWKNYNRRMSSWAKGILSRALTEVTAYRNAHLHLVNAAYTSQIDSMTQLLEGKRVGDKFYCANGDVLHADTNAALNILARFYDVEISRYMPYQQVREILLKRSIGGTDRQGLELHATL